MMALDKTFASGEVLSAGDVNNYLRSLWTPIDKRVVTSGSPASSVSFASIDSNFRLFRLSAYASLGGNILQLRLNNDSGNNYSTQVLQAGGTGVSAFRQTAQPQIVTDGAGAVGAQPYVCTMVISKTLATVGAAVSGTTVRENTVTINHFGGVWQNTSVLINRIDLFVASSTMHGVFALEGMRGV